mmetsp:Transcript_19832/g.41619  ORF Transcript_19832/g.41619 Transcript_19832/m.41619 type:complete len:470 (-) Transcript_19832:141-1550(-)
MSGIIAAAVSGVTWCFCTASASLCSSWCGNDKPSTVPPSASSGRKRSVLLLAFSVFVALIFQYAVAPRLQEDQLAANAPYVGELLVEKWTAGCTGKTNPELVEVCSGYAGAYRASSSAFAFFCIFAIAAKCRSTANRESWPAKYVLYIFLCIGSVFISNGPLFIPIYLNVARAGSIIFILFQQLVLIDIAFNWNENWVAKSDRAEVNEGHGKGRKWLFAILFSCGVLYIGSFVAIVLMYVYFGGCSTNEAFISITLVMTLLCTIIQLTTSDTGSLLTSAAITAYATYLCGLAISKNPNFECNPRLGETSTGNIILGLVMTTISLLWTGWSSTADKRVGGHEDENAEDIEAPIPETKENQKVGGVVLDSGYGSSDSMHPEAALENERHDITNNDPSFGSSWKLNAVLALVCCWYAMALTSWGAVEKSGDIANPAAGEVSMWMVIVSQWVCLALYLWTLVAPSIFPSRDFS